MNTQVFSKNRAQFPVEELRKHEGKWVAFSADGRTIVASADGLAELDRLLVASGADPEQVGLERVEFDEETIGGAEQC